MQLSCKSHLGSKHVCRHDRFNNPAANRQCNSCSDFCIVPNVHQDADRHDQLRQQLQICNMPEDLGCGHTSICPAHAPPSNQLQPGDAPVHHRSFQQAGHMRREQVDLVDGPHVPVWTICIHWHLGLCGTISSCSARSALSH